MSLTTERTEQRKVYVDETTTILVTPGGVVVDTDRAPRNRTRKLCLAVQAAVGRLVAEGHRVRRTRTHTFEPQGVEHCGSCADDRPRVMLCGVCGCCRGCCTKHAWEQHWWEADEPAGIEDIQDQVQEISFRAGLWMAELESVRTLIRLWKLSAVDLESWRPHLGLSNSRFAEATGYSISARDRETLARVLAVGGIEVAQARLDEKTREATARIAALLARKAELVAEFAA